MQKYLLGGILVLLFCLYGAVSFADGLDTKTVEDSLSIKERATFVMKSCEGCHSITADNTEPAAPTLYGIIGRDIASVGGYHYSEALKKVAETYPKWTEGLLNAYLADPIRFLQTVLVNNRVRGKMGYALRRKVDRDAILLYLKGLNSK